MDVRLQFSQVCASTAQTYESIITVRPAELPPVCNVPSVELLQRVKEFSLEELKMETMKRPAATQSQKLMIFVLTMDTLRNGYPVYRTDSEFSGGGCGVFRGIFSVHPLVLSMLFDPISAALGAATGELVFSEIMLGQFGGLGELEKFITVTIGVYLAGRMVKDPKNHKMVGIAALTGTGVQPFLGMLVDIFKVQFCRTGF